MSFDQNMLVLTFRMQKDDEHLTENYSSTLTATLAAVAAVTLNKKSKQ